MAKEKITGVVLFENRIYWKGEGGNICFDLEQPCKKGQTPSETILAEVIWDRLKYVNLQNLRDELIKVSRKLLEVFEIKKK